MRITIFDRSLPDGGCVYSIGGSQTELTTTSADAKATIDRWLRIAYEQGRADAKAEVREVLGFT